MTVKRSASIGPSVRQECVAAPVPCTRNSGGPAPMTCTCQTRPADRTNRLADRFGQSCSRQSLTRADRIQQRGRGGER